MAGEAQGFLYGLQHKTYTLPALPGPGQPRGKSKYRPVATEADHAAHPSAAPDYSGPSVQELSYGAVSVYE